MPLKPEIHFHIRWGYGRVDWERFSTCSEAMRSATELALPHERYTVERFDGLSCQHCKRGFTLDLECA